MIDEIAQEAAASIRTEASQIAAALDLPDWLVLPISQSSVSPTPSSLVRLRRSPIGNHNRNRRRRIGIVLAGVVLLAGVWVIVQSISRQGSPAPIRPTSTQPAGIDNTDPGSTPPAASTRSTGSAIAPVTTTASPVDLSGTTTGLFIPPTVLPDGGYAVAATPEDAYDGGGLDVAWQTIAGKYAAGRTTLDEVVTVQVGVGILDGATPSDAQPLDVRSTTGHLAGQDLDWVENGNTVIVTASAPGTDLVAIANGLTTRADGGFDFGYLPTSFEQIAVTPGTDSFGAGFYTAYATAQSTDADGAVLSVRSWSSSSRPAEVTLATSVGYGSSRLPSVYATEINGRRAIVSPGLAPRIVWDEVDGTQISIEYVPLEGDGSVDERTRTAIQFASTLRRATTSQWTDLLSHLAANEARYESAAYMADQVAALHLTIAGTSRPTNVRHPGILVAVQDKAGQDAGTCEFFHRQLVTCDTPQQQAERNPNRFDAALLANGYVRVIAGSATTTAILSFKDTKVTSTVRLTPLSFSSNSPGVAYLAVRGDPTTMCLSFQDASGEPVSMTTDPNTGGALRSCTPA